MPRAPGLLPVVHGYRYIVHGCPYIAHGHPEIEVVTDPPSVKKVAKFQPAPPRVWQRKRR
jgi:hypothetical protein